MRKQRFVERVYNLDVDRLRDQFGNTTWDKVIWKILKPYIRKLLIAAIELLFKDDEVDSGSDTDH